MYVRINVLSFMYSFFFFGGNCVCVKNDKCYFVVLEMKGDGWNRIINISVFIVCMLCVLF